MNKLLIAVATVFSFITAGVSRDVVFIGLNGDAAPSIEKTYERILREHLSVLPNINAVDYLEAQQYKKMINFGDYPTVSKTLVETLDRFASDTTFFIWGTIKRCSVEPIRRYLVGAAIKGELTISLTMYSLSERNYAYSGTISATYIKNKGLVFFSPVNEVVHVSALDRTEILEQIENSAVQQSGRMISAVVRAEVDRNKEPTPEVDKYKVPSLSDVFKVPSMEAKTIPAIDTVAKDTTSASKKISDTTKVTPTITKPEVSGK